MMTDKGTLFVVSAPSGTGKGTILSEFNRRFKDEKIIYSVSATTRKPRCGEENGKDYYFLTKDEFIERINSDMFLEYAKFCDNYYGTPKTTVIEAIENGTDVILEIETVGAMNIKKNLPEAVLIFILPPSVQELEKRLSNRGTEEADTIKKRIDTAKKELTLTDSYDYVIVNDKFEKAAEQFNYIINAERLKTQKNKKTISEVLKNDLSCN